MRRTPSKTPWPNASSSSRETSSKSSAEVSPSFSSQQLLTVLAFLEFFAMRNLTEGMTRPCVIDVKLGSLAYNPKKLDRQKWKAESSTSATHGFRLCGLSYFDRGEQEQKTVNKYMCRSFKVDEMREYLGRFFGFESCESSATHKQRLLS